MRRNQNEFEPTMHMQWMLMQDILEVIRKPFALGDP